MRLDVFLKKTALVRQRGLAKDLCVAGAVSVDGRVAKASHLVRVGERIVLRAPGRELEARVLEVPRGNVARRDAARYVEVLRDTRTDPVTRVLQVDAPVGSERNAHDEGDDEPAADPERRQDPKRSE